MTTDAKRRKAANNWNCSHIDFLIEYMEKTKDVLETFEILGKEAKKMIDNQITELESLKMDYKMEE